jgi:hypothetical protein
LFFCVRLISSSIVAIFSMISDILARVPWG